MAFGRSKNDDETVHTSDEEIATPVAGGKTSKQRKLEPSFS